MAESYRSVCVLAYFTDAVKTSTSNRRQALILTICAVYSSKVRIGR